MGLYQKSGQRMNYPNRKTDRPGTTRRVRKDGHDYSYPGFYFVTICTSNRQHLFGQIENDSIQYSPAGEMITAVIQSVGSKFETVSLDQYVVMPNHIHILVGLSVRMQDLAGEDHLANVVKWIKNASVRRYSLGVRQGGWRRYEGDLWQKGYHDHIVRNESELDTIRRYIATNPESWEKDKFYDGRIDW